MSNYNFNYAFNISGNCNAAMRDLLKNVEALNKKVNDTTTSFAKLEKIIIWSNQASQLLTSLKDSLQKTLAPGAALNASLADLQAISGATAEELVTIEKAARSTATEFGVSASGAVESYKLLLSQLSPELTKNTAALNHMGKNVATLSKMMKGDATAAAEVLTTAMNQYGVSLDDPLAASNRMWEMMNTMAAAAREGSAELPAIKVALEQCGMAAKAAGVSFEETNAAIQVLDKAGKKGSEGGVALRNVMSTLAQGRFLPKDVREELSAAGISVNDLTDKTKTLAERLEVLKPVMADDALFSKLFGKENSAAAMALVQGIPKVQQWTEAITGTTTAIDQSQIIMETYNERLARVQAKFDDIKISIFNSCGDLGIWTQVVVGALVPLSQLVPLIYGAAKAIIFLKSVNFKGAFTGVVSSIRNVIVGLAMQNIAITASGGYWLAFKAVATNVCRSIGVAIMNIPIAGWIAAGIAAVIAVVKLLWDRCKGFRVAVFTAWEGIKAIFSYAWGLITGIAQRIAEFATGVWESIKAIAQKVANAFMEVVNKIRSWFTSIRSFISSVFNWIVGKIGAVIAPFTGVFRKIADAVRRMFGEVLNWISEKFYSLINWFIDKYNWLARKLNFKQIARLGREAAEKSWASDHPEKSGTALPAGSDGITPVTVPETESPIGKGLGGIGGGASKETDRIKNINITIDRLIDKFTISTTNLSESKERIKDAVAEALLLAVNDVNYAL